MTTKTALDWKMEQNLLQRASEQAEELLKVLGLNSLPIDPFEIVSRERQVKLVMDDFRNRFDGQIEYLKPKRRFLLLLNSKYDRGFAEGKHHVRTRFSLGHELGHLYLEHHAAYLVSGGKPHGSKGEFDSTILIEREADAYSAGLLMPQGLFSESLNVGEPSLALIDQLAAKFHTSPVSTLYRAVRLSDFPCSVVAVKNGQVAWSFISEPLIEAGCYPPTRGSPQSAAAKDAAQAFADGDYRRGASNSSIRQWFRTYDRHHLEDVFVAEEFLPVPWTNTLLVLLSVSEKELMDAEGDDDD
jgi:hypothetical protein